jgi:hypothetical protein
MADEPPPRDTDDEAEPKLALRWIAVAVRPYLGWIFVGAGALLVFLGYMGVSGEAIVGKQMPYLVSGGVGGVLLAIVGAYFLGTEALHEDSGRLDRLERMVDELHRALLERPDAPELETAHSDRAAGATSGSPNGHGARAVVVVDGGETYHRDGCAMTGGSRELSTVTVEAATEQGLRACPVCEPATTTA